MADEFTFIGNDGEYADPPRTKNWDAMGDLDRQLGGRPMDEHMLPRHGATKPNVPMPGGAEGRAIEADWARRKIGENPRWSLEDEAARRKIEVDQRRAGMQQGQGMLVGPPPTYAGPQRVSDIVGQAAPDQVGLASGEYLPDGRFRGDNGSLTRHRPLKPVLTLDQAKARGTVDTERYDIVDGRDGAVKTTGPLGNRSIPSQRLTPTQISDKMNRDPRIKARIDGMKVRTARGGGEAFEQAKLTKNLQLRQELTGAYAKALADSNMPRANALAERMIRVGEDPGHIRSVQGAMQLQNEIAGRAPELADQLKTLNGHVQAGDYGELWGLAGKLAAAGYADEARMVRQVGDMTYHREQVNAETASEEAKLQAEEAMKKLPPGAEAFIDKALQNDPDAVTGLFHLILQHGGQGLEQLKDMVGLAGDMADLSPEAAGQVSPRYQKFIQAGDYEGAAKLALATGDTKAATAARLMWAQDWRTKNAGGSSGMTPAQSAQSYSDAQKVLSWSTLMPDYSPIEKGTDHSSRVMADIRSFFGAMEGEAGFEEVKMEWEEEVRKLQSTDDIEYVRGIVGAVQRALGKQAIKARRSGGTPAATAPAAAPPVTRPLQPTAPSAAPAGPPPVDEAVTEILGG